MHRLRVDRGGEFAGVGDFGRHAAGGDFILQPVKSVLGDQQPQFFAFWIEQCVAHRVQSEQPDRFRRIAAPGLFFFNDPIGLFGFRFHRGGPNFRRHVARAALRRKLGQFSGLTFRAAPA